MCPDQQKYNTDGFGGGRPASAGGRSGQSASSGYQEWDPRHPNRVAERARLECRRLRLQWRLEVERAEMAELRLKWADQRLADAEAEAQNRARR